jgi:predicted acylesterase/phospholipase RssA
MNDLNQQDFWAVRGLGLEGGGVKGLAYLPVIKHLARSQSLHKIKHLAGTSAGAITAMLLAMRISHRRLERVLWETDWSLMKGPTGFPRGLRYLWRFNRRWGLHRLDYARAWLEMQARALAWKPQTTFRELYETTGVNLMVVVTDEQAARPFVLAHDSSPSLDVVTGVLASMAIPVYFEPVRVGGRVFSDGGLTHNYPVDLLRDRVGLPLSQIIGVRVDSSEELQGYPAEVTGAFSRLARVMDIVHTAANRSHVDEELWRRTLRIDTGSVKATDFNLKDEDRQELVACGERALQAVIGGTPKPPRWHQ